MPEKVLFIDRDGTLIVEPEDQQIDSLEKLAFLPFALSSLSRIASELDYTLVLVSNQDGLGTASFPEADFHPAQNKMLQMLEAEGIRFADIFIDRSFEADGLPTRKPGTGMLSKYIYGDYDLANSFVIGDRLTDVQLAENLGAQAIFIGKEGPAATALTTTCWKDIYRFLQSPPRCVTLRRQTLETAIDIRLNLDGSGKAEIHTGLPFFDHMLDQLARHGAVDLDLSVKGDLDVDEHHTIEDTALALGEAFRIALGKKKGIRRYGFLLPMDDALAHVAIDFGGRPWLVWDAEFKREKVGDMPTEMFYHFFKSFSDEARCNLNIRVEGQNEHHKIEAIFKAFARAIRMAVAPSGQFDIPSTKGNL